MRIFASDWLASQLQLEDGVAPLLDAAYRLGPLRRAPNALPRDILIQCSDLQTRQKILSLSRAKGHLCYLSHKIQVLQDLSSETLEASQKLQPLTSLLSKEKIRYRWQAFVKVQLIYKGASILVYDDDSAVSMLESLGLEIPESFHHPSSPEKRKE